MCAMALLLIIGTIVGGFFKRSGVRLPLAPPHKINEGARQAAQRVWLPNK